MIGGQYGEITVAMQYSFQAWNAHIPGKYRDLLFSTAAEEFGHVEMLATMVAQLLEDAPLGITEAAVQNDPAVAAVIGGTDGVRVGRRRHRRALDRLGRRHRSGQTEQGVVGAPSR